MGLNEVLLWVFGWKKEESCFGGRIEIWGGGGVMLCSGWWMEFGICF